MLKPSHRIVIAWCGALLIGLVVFERYVYMSILSGYQESGFSLHWSAQDFLQIAAGCYLFLLGATGRFQILRNAAQETDESATERRTSDTIHSADPEKASASE